MIPPVSTILSSIFLVFGAIAVFTMLKHMGGSQDQKAVLVKIHRWAGWGFAVLFLMLFIFMVERAEEYWEASSARIALHVALAVASFFLLLVKVMIPRFFRRLSKHLFAIGVSLYLLGFTLVLITAGYYLIWKVREIPYISHAELPAHILDVELGKQLFIDECSTCHILDRIMRPRSISAWENIVNEMVALAAPRITVDEAAQILHYLKQTHVPQKVEMPQAPIPLQKYCLPCHARHEIFSEDHTKMEWTAIVQRMREYGPDIIPEERIEEIVDFLLEEQKQE